MAGAILRVISIVHVILIHELLAENNTIQLRNSGILPLLKAEIALTFYATVENLVDLPYTIGLKMDKCCQFVNNGGMDCESMTLHGGLNIKFSPKDVRNLTMYYTNLYLHGRNGTCSVRLGWRVLTATGDVDLREALGHQEFEILFNTVLPEQNFLFQFWQNDPEKYSLCSSVDEDPTNGCNPILSPFSNKYFSLPFTLNFTENLVSSLSSKIETIATDYKSYPVNSVCVNGLINDTRCECQKGWTSNKFPSETFNPNSDTHSMCDVRTWDGAEGNRAQRASAILYIILVLVMLLIVALCLCIPTALRKCLRKKSYECMPDKDCSKPTNKVNVLDSSIKVISEVKDRREIRLRPAKSYPTQQVLAREQKAADFQPKQTRVVSNLNLETNAGTQTSFEYLSETNYYTSGKAFLPKAVVQNDCCMNPDKLVSPSTSKKKLLHIPQFSKSKMSVLPAPLIPVKVYSDTAFKNSGNNIEAKDGAQLQSKIEAPRSLSVESLSKLKSLMKEVELSTRQLSEDVEEITGGVSDQSLDRSTALNMEKVLPQSESSFSLEGPAFWENISDSDSEISSESTFENNDNTGFWLNRLRDELEQMQNESDSKLADPSTMNASSVPLTGDIADRNFESPNDIQEEEVNQNQKESTPVCCSPVNIQGNADVSRLFMKASERTESLDHVGQNGLDHWY